MRWALTLVLCFALLPFTPARLEAVTIRDIIDLTRAGLGDEVLLALIEVDGGVFTIDTPTLMRLKEAGVSERVIVALVRSGRSQPVEASPPAATQSETWPEPQVIVIEHERPIVQPVAVPVAVPVYVTVPVRPSARARVRTAHQPLIPFSGFGVPVAHPALPDVKKADPIYWGWGGKRRPDTWQEPPKHR